MPRQSVKACFFNATAFGYGVTWDAIHAGIEYVYETLGKLDATLIGAGSPRFSQLIELANLSSILGNLLATCQQRSWMERDSRPNLGPGALV